MKSYFFFTVDLLTQKKHTVALIKERGSSVPELYLRDNSFPYPPFETYKWKIFEKEVNTTREEGFSHKSSWKPIDDARTGGGEESGVVNVRTENGESGHFVQEGGSSPVHVYFSFKKLGNFKIRVYRLKEGYDDVVENTQEIEVEVVNE